MDEENQINGKLKIMKFSLLPCGLNHTQFLIKKNLLLFLRIRNNEWLVNLIKMLDFNTAECREEDRGSEYKSIQSLRT